MWRPKISIIVSCYNKRGTIEKCIESLLSQSYKNYEIVVVDDGSDDGSSQLVENYSFLPNVKIIHSTHAGPSATKNIGIKNAGGDVLFFFDGDCVAPPTLLEDFSRILLENGVDCVGGGVVSLDGSNTISKTVELMQDQPDRKWPFGTNVAYKRRVIEMVGPFDELMTAGEDVDYYLRTCKIGFNFLISSNIRVWTENPTSLWSFFKQRFRWARGFAYLSEKHPAVFTPRVKACFILSTAMLFSILLSIIDLRLLFVPFVLFLVDILRFIPHAYHIAKRSGNKRCATIVPILRFINALAYLFGWSYEKLRLLVGKRKKFELFDPNLQRIRKVSPINPFDGKGCAKFNTFSPPPFELKVLCRRDAFEILS